MFHRHYISIFSLISIIIPSSCQDFPCTTPLRYPGGCRNIRDCKDMMDYLRTRSIPWTHSVESFITKSKCNVVDNTGRDTICCPYQFRAFDEGEINPEADSFHLVGRENLNQTYIQTILNSIGLGVGQWIFEPYDLIRSNIFPVISSYVNLGSGVQVKRPLIPLGKIRVLETNSPTQSTVDHKTASPYVVTNKGYPYNQAQGKGYADRTRTPKPGETRQESQKRTEENRKSTNDKDSIKNSSILPQNYNNHKGNGNRGGSGQIDGFKESSTESQDQNIFNLLPEMCGKSEANRYQIGNTVDIFDFPWMALLVYSDDSSSGLNYQCGGSIITSRYVLTAASCLKSSLIGVRVGEHDTNTDDDCQYIGVLWKCSPAFQDFLIDDQFTHSSYKGSNRFPSTQNDVGLIKLDRAIEFKENAQPICLPMNTELKNINMNDKVLILAGWGATENGITREKPIKSNITTTSKRDCEKILNRSPSDRTVPRQLCASGFEGIESCGGDSGGAMMLHVMAGTRSRFVQFGILGEGSSRCGAGATALYSNVVHYIDWILETIAK